jgi:ketosteroid isomerase-like protein
MSAEQTWHAQMEAVRRGDWDVMPGYFAPDCTWTLMPPGTAFRGRAEIVRFMQGGFGASAEREEPDVRNEFAADEWGVLEYTSRGVIDAAKLGVTGSGGEDLAGQLLAGRQFEVPVCFVYHVNADGLIDRVNEYAAMPPLPAVS